MDLILDAVIYFFVGSSVVSMVRVLIGPTTVDRMIGLNMVAAQILALLVLVAVQQQLAGGGDRGGDPPLRQRPGRDQSVCAGR